MEARLIAFAIVAACSSGGGQAPGPANAPPVAPEPARVTIVSDVATASANLGKRVEVHGTARNAKIAAAVTAGDLVVYCLGIDGWPTKVANTAVVARGTLEHTDEFAAGDSDGEITAGTSGAVYVLRACEYGAAPP